MVNITGQDGEVIEVPFPEVEFNKYLERVDVKDIKELGLHKRHTIFIAAIEDWKKGILSLDALSNIASYMWDHLPEKADRDHPLYEAMYACGELNYYLRHADTAENFSSFLKETLQYYNENKEKYKLQ